MSSSDYGFDDEFDSHILNELDSIEAAYCKPPPPVEKASKPLHEEDSFFDLSLDLDDEELQRLDTFIDAAYKRQAPPVAGPSNLASSSKNTVQTTLCGDIVQPMATQSPSKRVPPKRTKSSPRNPFGKQAPQIRHWNHTAFAKSGWKKPKSAKGKGRDDGDEDDEEHVEFEQFPAPFLSGRSQPSVVSELYRH